MEWDFSAPVDKIESVPEDFRGLYVKDGEKFKINDADGTTKSAVAAILGLNNALRASRGETKGLKDKFKGVDLSPLAEYGATAEEIAAKVKELQASKPNIEKLKQDFAQQNASELTKRDGRIKSLTSQLESLLIDGAITKELLEHKGDPDLLLPFAKSQARVIEEDGKFRLVIVDKAGDPRYSGTTGAPFSVTDLVKEMKSNPKYSKLFQSDAPAGAGTPPSGHFPRANPTQQSREDMSATQKIQAGLDKGNYIRGRRA